MLMLMLQLQSKYEIGFFLNLELFNNFFLKIMSTVEYSGTSVKQPPRGVVFFGCLREVAAQRRYSLMGNFDKSGELI